MRARRNVVLLGVAIGATTALFVLARYGPVREWRGGRATLAGGEERPAAELDASRPADLLRGASAEAARSPVAPLEEERELARSSLAVRVRWEDGIPAEGVLVGLRPTGSRWCSIRAVTDPEGIARFALDPGEVALEVDRAEPSVLRLEPGESRTHEVVLPEGNAIKGLVVTPDRSAFEGARILLYNHRSALSPALVAHSDGDGGFWIRSVPLGMSEVCAEVSGRVPSPRIQLQSKSPGYTHTVVLELGPPGGNLAGRVLSRDGAPVRGALVRVGDWPLDDGEVTLENGENVAPYLPRDVWTDEEGVFLAEGLAAGAQTIRIQAASYAYWSSDVSVPMGSTGSIEVTLVPEAIVSGRVCDPGGAPIPDVKVLRRMGHPMLEETLLTESGPDGAFELRGLPAGRNELVAMKGKAYTTASVDLAAGEARIWSAVLHLGFVLSGHLEVPSECEQEFAVDCWDLGTGEIQTEYLMGSGFFSFYGLAPGPHRILVQSRASGFTSCHELANPGQPPLDIHVDCSTVPSIRIRGRVVRRSGPVGDIRVVPSGPGLENYTEWHRTRPDGTFDLGLFLPGEWSIELRKGQTSQVLLSTRARAVAPRETLDLGTLELDS